MVALATTSQVERYEYKFVRVGEYRESALFGVRDSERETATSSTSRHARAGGSSRSSPPSQPHSAPPGTTS